MPNKNRRNSVPEVGVIYLNLQCLILFRHTCDTHHRQNRRVESRILPATIQITHLECTARLRKHPRIETQQKSDNRGKSVEDLT